MGQLEKPTQRAGGISYDASVPMGEEEVLGRQTMVGVFRNGQLLQLFLTQKEAEKYFKADNAIGWLHQVEKYGWKFRILRVEVGIITPKGHGPDGWAPLEDLELP